MPVHKRHHFQDHIKTLPHNIKTLPHFHLSHRFNEYCSRIIAKISAETAKTPLFRHTYPWEPWFKRQDSQETGQPRPIARMWLSGLFAGLFRMWLSGLLSGLFASFEIMGLFAFKRFAPMDLVLDVAGDIVAVMCRKLRHLQNDLCAE